jgi:hypothetical protein
MDCVNSQLRPSPALTRLQTRGSAFQRREAYGDPDRHQFLPIATHLHTSALVPVKVTVVVVSTAEQTHWPGAPYEKLKRSLL